MVDLSGSSISPEGPILDAVKDPIHFIGIGGIGMSALARLMMARGRRVSGSDKAESPITQELKDLGARIHIGHDAAHVGDAGAIVVSTAITMENPERAAAQKRALPVFHRSDVLSWLAESSRAIAVSGTHGKTTTTGMIAQVFIDSGLDPSVVVGGIFPKVNSNARVGRGSYFIAEADESDRTHASFKSYLSVVTNIEPDHLENYPGGFKQILDTMASFVSQSHSTVMCLDDPGCRELLGLINLPVITYGSRKVSPGARYTLEPLDTGAFIVFHDGRSIGQVQLSVPGLHNQMNALATVAVALECGLSFQTVQKSLESFTGVERRFQVLGTASGITVVDDYGHHPTEVRATLEAARQYLRNRNTGGRVVALFQPHQPGRLRDLWTDFCESFEEADVVLLTDIYVARGGNIEGITSSRFAREIRHDMVTYLPGPTNELPEKIAPVLRDGDVILTIGAGDITNVGKPLLLKLSDTRDDGRSAQ